MKTTSTKPEGQHGSTVLDKSYEISTSTSFQLDERLQYLLLFITLMGKHIQELQLRSVELHLKVSGPDQILIDFVLHDFEVGEATLVLLGAPDAVQLSAPGLISDLESAICCCCSLLRPELAVRLVGEIASRLSRLHDVWEVEQVYAGIDFRVAQQ